MFYTIYAGGSLENSGLSIRYSGELDADDCFVMSEDEYDAAMVVGRRGVQGYDVSNDNGVYLIHPSDMSLDDICRKLGSI